MLKYLAKFASDILPSVAATIIGAYIVNHYITTKPSAPAPAVASAPAVDSKPTDAPTNVANIPGDGVRAKGISEKAVFEKAAAEKPTAEKPQDKAQEKTAEKAKEKPQEKSEDKPAETASISADIHRRPAPPHEKTAIRTIPLTAAPSVQPAASTAVSPNPPPVIEATANRTSIAMPMIWRGRRSSACARIRRAHRTLRVVWMLPTLQPRRSRRRRCSLSRRRSWLTRLRAILLLPEQTGRCSSPIHPRHRPTIPIVRSRRPTFRHRNPLSCGPTTTGFRPCSSTTRTSLKTCWRLRSRSFMRSCRSSAFIAFASESLPWT